jgi:hypothetical protein
MGGKGYVMSILKQRLLTGIAVAALCGSHASAADYPSPPPQQQVIYQQVPVPVPVREFDGWYRFRDTRGLTRVHLKQAPSSGLVSVINTTTGCASI